MIKTPSNMRSGFLLRGAGIGGVGPYCGTPPPKDGGPNRALG
jgi:hypothetical protein